MTGASSERWQAEVDARLARLELQGDELDLVKSGFGAELKGEPSTGERYPDLDSWVQNYFCITFSRPLGGEFRWCSRWQEHREAVMRLEALWSSWRALRSDPALGLATWLHQFLDPQLPILLSASGPFRACSTTRHEIGVSMLGIDH